MRLPYLRAAVVCDILLLSSVSQLVAAAASEPPGPLWIQPSGEWYVPHPLCSSHAVSSDGARRYGIDGTWSSFTFYVGSPAQIVYLTVATALSEIWVVSTGGCLPSQYSVHRSGGPSVD